MLKFRLMGGPVIGRTSTDRRFGRARFSPQFQRLVEKQLGDCLILAHERKAHAEVGLSSIIFRPGHLRFPDGFKIQLCKASGVPKLKLLPIGLLLYPPRIGELPPRISGVRGTVGGGPHWCVKHRGMTA